MRKIVLLTSLAMLGTLFLAMPVLAQEEYPAICGANTLDQFPEGTVCTEGGGFILPEEQYEVEEPPVVQYEVEEPAAPQATPAATTQPLPATGGPSLVLLAGALLIGGGLILRGRRS